MRSALIYTDEYVQYAYSETHPLKPYRLKLTHDLMQSYGLCNLPHSRMVQTVPAGRAELTLFHTRDYLEVLEMASVGVHRQDYSKYGLGPGDNPIFPGMYAWSQLCAGGTLQAARLVSSGAVEVAFHSAGGLHHGMPERASGFCYVNDPVIAITELVQQGYRVAYIDIDVHHGDGVQAAFYDTDGVLTISLHEDGSYLFPGTGFVDEIGVGKGQGYAVNVPFPPGMDDALFLEGFDAVVPPLIEAYKPDVVFTQLGVDSFHDDPLAHGRLTTAGFTQVLRHLKALAPRWIATGGGGYNLGNVARAWTLAWGIMNDVEVPDEIPETAQPQLQQVGYSGKTLRDVPMSLHHTHREPLRAELHATLGYLQQHVFPIHGLRAAHG
jgi:acetoin utilization protein AcuC